ncbi:hypothetical protein BH23ACT6_BH23ACT6_15290 [soil metagenome]
MQASVHEFDGNSGTGTLLLDSGLIVSFGAHVFAASGLRLLRVGQRLSIELEPSSQENPAETPTQTPDAGTPTTVTRMWIIGIGDSERIR